MKAGSDGYKLPFKAPEEDEEEIKEATMSLQISVHATVASEATAVLTKCSSNHFEGFSERASSFQTSIGFLPDDWKN